MSGEDKLVAATLAAAILQAKYAPRTNQVGGAPPSAVEVVATYRQVVVELGKTSTP